MTVPALNHYTNDVTFSTSQYYINSTNTSAASVDGMTIIVKQIDLGTLTLDANTAAATAVTSIPGGKKVLVEILYHRQGAVA